MSLFIIQVLEVEEPTVQVKLDPVRGHLQHEQEPEHISESQHPDASITQNQDSASLSSDPLSGSAAELEDNIANRQDIITSVLFKRAIHSI